MPCIYGARLCNYVDNGVHVGTLTLDRAVMNYEISSTVEKAGIRVSNFNIIIYLMINNRFPIFTARTCNESASKHEIVLASQGCFRN
jgi:hypothetical protein